jgi:prolyl-tRNA synthetase
VEQSHDSDGIIWPIAVAPYAVVVQILDLGNPLAREAAEKLYAQLLAEGWDVLIDDRDERPGVKFKDADLLGIPFQIRVGKKFIDSGKFEIRNRATKVSEESLPGDVLLKITQK